METTTSAPAVRQQQKTIGDLIQSDDFKARVAHSLPKHMTADRFVRVALVAMNRNPRLLGCSKESLFQCLYDLSAMGLEPDGRRAHLIPYKDTCTLIVDYKGVVELAMNAGDVSSIHADVICENDEFEYDRGQVIAHKINLRKPRGAMYGAYCIIKFKSDADPKCEVMNKEEIDSIRARSRAKDSGPWVTDYNEMAKKTVFRRASKWIKLSPEIRDAMEKDDDVIEIPSSPAKPVFSESINLFDEEDVARKDAVDQVVPKPKRGAKTEPESPIPDGEGDKKELTGDALMTALNACLVATKVTAGQLLQWAIDNDHCGKDATDVLDLPEAKLRMFIDRFAVIERQIKEAK